MLFVIGGLYGFIGGGLFGLSLEERKDRKIDWGTVIVAMLSGAIISYFFIIMQLEWLMTPPRSEAWRRAWVCLWSGLVPA
jgi:fluoride ion exporter CrcB/FEX